MDSLDWIEFQPSEDRTVFTADLCSRFTCEKCPGFVAMRELRPDHSSPEATVFCVHWCHKVTELYT